MIKRKIKTKIRVLICQHCGKEFENKYRQKRKYCSYACAGKSFQKERKTIKCKNCNKEFEVKKFKALQIKFCCRACYIEYKKKQNTRICPICGKTFSHNKKKTIHCGRKCMGKARTKAHKRNGKVKNKALDDIWAKIIKLKARNQCEYCGKIGRLNSHHIFSRSNLSTRWDLDNGVCLCVSHHVFNNFSAHKAPIEFCEWLKEKRGVEWYETLRKKARTLNHQINRDDLKFYLEEQKEKYQGILQPPN